MDPTLPIFNFLNFFLLLKTKPERNRERMGGGTVVVARKTYLAHSPPNLCTHKQHTFSRGYPTRSFCLVPRADRPAPPSTPPPPKPHSVNCLPPACLVVEKFNIDKSHFSFSFDLSRLEFCKTSYPLSLLFPASAFRFHNLPMFGSSAGSRGFLRTVPTAKNPRVRALKSLIYGFQCGWQEHSPKDLRTLFPKVEKHQGCLESFAYFPGYQLILDLIVMCFQQIFDARSGAVGSVE